MHILVGLIVPGMARGISFEESGRPESVLAPLRGLVNDPTRRFHPGNSAQRVFDDRFYRFAAMTGPDIAYRRFLEQ